MHYVTTTAPLLAGSIRFVHEIGFSPRLVDISCLLYISWASCASDVQKGNINVLRSPPLEVSQSPNHLTCCFIFSPFLFRLFPSYIVSLPRAHGYDTHYPRLIPLPLTQRLSRGSVPSSAIRASVRIRCENMLALTMFYHMMAVRGMGFHSACISYNDLASTLKHFRRRPLRQPHSSFALVELITTHLRHSVCDSDSRTTIALHRIGERRGLISSLPTAALRTTNLITLSNADQTVSNAEFLLSNPPKHESHTEPPRCASPARYTSPRTPSPRPRFPNCSGAQQQSSEKRST